MTNTSIVTEQSVSPDWIKRISDRKIRLSDFQPYVFCKRYQQHNQRRGPDDAFEIYFVSDEGKVFPQLYFQFLTPFFTSSVFPLSQRTESRNVSTRLLML